MSFSFYAETVYAEYAPTNLLGIPLVRTALPTGPMSAVSSAPGFFPSRQHREWLFGCTPVLFESAVLVQMPIEIAREVHQFIARPVVPNYEIMPVECRLRQERLAVRITTVIDHLRRALQAGLQRLVTDQHVNALLL